MPCLLALIALVAPRLVIILVLIFSNYLQSAYQTLIWPLLGFFFLPLTTLAYAFAYNSTGGTISGGYLVVIVVAVLVDLGSFGGAGGTAKQRRA